jgi:hypothetical protein
LAYVDVRSMHGDVILSMKTIREYGGWVPWLGLRRRLITSTMLRHGSKLLFVVVGGCVFHFDTTTFQFRPKKYFLASFGFLPLRIGMSHERCSYNIPSYRSTIFWTAASSLLRIMVTGSTHSSPIVSSFCCRSNRYCGWICSVLVRCLYGTPDVVVHHHRRT